MSKPYRKPLQRLRSTTLQRRSMLTFVLMVSSVSSACLDNELDPDQVDKEAADAGTGSDGDGGSTGPTKRPTTTTSTTTTGSGKKLFIAQNSAFESYKDWMTFAHEVKGQHEGLSGEMVIYVNQLPDPETKTFPVGSILFKTTLVDGFDKPVVHAMAKRGSGFNAGGALGWEYFELLMGKNDVPYILWRGAKPPAGEMYQALLGSANVERPMTTDADCNSCHAKGTDGALGDDVLNLLNGQ